MSSDVEPADLNVNTLDRLAATVKNEIQASKDAQSNALDHALNAGDALNLAQERVSTNWKRWVRESCDLASSTALLYQRLARHRAEIKAEIERIGELSLCAARRLISAPAEKTPKPKKPRPDLVAAWMRLTDSEITAALREIPLLHFLRVMPAVWRAELRNRGAHLDQTSSNPDPRISKIVQTALSHIATADQPGTGKPVAQGQENAALTALRTLLTVLHGIGCDLHDVEVVLKPKTSGAKKRAA